jgi:hypothetical protein
VPGTTVDGLERIVGPGGGVRVHAVEYAWLERIQTAAVGVPIAGAGIQLRILPDLHACFDAVAGSSLEFSAIRMRHAVPGDARAVRRPPNAPI